MRIRKIVWRIFKVVIVILLCFVVLFSIPYVQTKLAKSVVSYLNSNFKTNIQVEKVDLSFLSSATLKNVCILDHHKDTIIYVNKLSTSLLNVKKILNNKLKLGDVSLYEAKIYMKVYKGEDDDNMSIFIKKFDNGKPSDTLNPFRLTAKNIDFDHLTYKYINLNDRDSLKYSIKDGGGLIQDFSLVGSKVYMKTRGVYFKDKLGLDIKNLTTNFTYTDSKLEFKNTILTTVHRSKIQGDLLFSNRNKSFSSFLNKVSLNANITKSMISAIDLKNFYSDFSGSDKFNFSGKISGTLNELKIKSFKIVSKNGLKFQGDTKFINSFSLEKGFRFEGGFDELSVSYNLLNDLLPNIVTKTYKSNFEKLGYLSLSGFIDLTPKEMDAKLNIKTEIGDVSSSLHFNNYSDVDRVSYYGDISLLNFNLGEFIKEKSINKVSLKTFINGKGFVLRSLNSNLKGKIKKFTFKDYPYKNIDINGKVAEHKFDGLLKFNDDNLKMTFDGLADLSSKVNNFDFSADIKKFNLRDTNLFKRDSISEIQGKICINAKGNSIDDIIGETVFENFKYKNHKKEYDFDKFEIFSEVKDSIRTININSEEIIQGKLKGKFLFKELLPITKNALWSTYTNYEPEKVLDNQYIDFDFKIYNQIVDIFFTEITIEKNAKIKGKINAINNSVKIVADTPKIKAYDIEIDSLEFRIDNKNILYSSYLEAQKVKHKYYQISKLNLLNRIKSDTLYFKSVFKGGKKETEDYTLDFFYTFNSEKKSILGIQNSIFNINGKDWLINPNKDDNNKIAYNSKTNAIEIYPFLLTSNNQKVKFEGVFNDSIQQGNIKLKDINLLNIFPKESNFKLDGILNADLNYSDTDLKGGIKVTDFMINNISQGTLLANITNLNSLKKYKVDLSVRDYEYDNIKALGTIDLSKKSPYLDMLFKFNKYELDGFTKLGNDVISNIRGLVSGEFLAKGRLTNPDFKGQLNFEKTGLSFPYLNIDFDIAENSKVYLKNQSFIFDNTILKDTKHKTKGTLLGEIYHKDFSDWHLDLAINSNNLLVLDTKESDKEAYYGTAFLNGGAKIKGDVKNLLIKVDGKTEQNTKFVIPLSDVTMVDNYDLIKFKKPNQKEVTKAKKFQSFSGLNLLMNLEITKQAVAEVVIDKVNKSDLKGRGNGNLSIQINTNGGFKMFGDLLIDNGIYNFRYAGIPKKFEVQKGGTISWNGDPFKAELDIVAIYKARANPSKLLDDIVSYRKIPVNLYTRITGELFDSKQEFDIKIPNADSSVSSELEFRFENDKNSKMLNFASLLLGNTFYNNEVKGISSNIVTSTASDVLSNVFSDFINSEDSKLKLNVGYTQGDKTKVEDLKYDDQFDFSIQGQISDRVLFNGKLGVPVGASNIQSTVVGEARLEVLLNKSGSLRWNIFNKPNDIQYSLEEQGYTQGTGFSYQVGFDNFSQLLRKIGLKKSKKNKN